MNLNASDHNRAANHTHGCLPGYGGPICGVCSAAERYAQASGTCVPCGNELINAVVVACLPFVLAALVVWISLYRKVQASADSQVLTRILLTYLQTMGTLSSIYLARGTAEFRALFGFTTAVGDSPLSLTPITCTLRLPFYVRFLITVSLPFSIAVLVLLTNLAALALARMRKGAAVGGSAAAADASAGAAGASRRRLAKAQSAARLAADEAAAGVLAVAGKVKAADAAADAKAEANAEAMAGAEVGAEARVGLATAGAGDSLLTQLSADVRRFFATQAWVAPVIFVLNASYSSLTTTSFNMFNCMPYSVGGATYLAQDLSVTCFDGVHNGFRGLAGLLIGFFGAGFPLLFAALLRRHRAELHSPEVFARLGFLYDGYSVERGMFAWESVVMVRKAAIVMIGSLVKDAYRQIFASVSLLVVMLFLQATLQPYEKRLFNFVEGAALVTIMLTQLVSMFYLRGDSLSAQCQGKSAAFVVDLQGTTCEEVAAGAAANDLLTTVLMALINAGFLGGAAALMLRSCAAEAEAKAPTSLLARGVRRISKRAAVLRRRGSGAPVLSAEPPGRAQAGAAAAMATGRAGAEIGNAIAVKTVKNPLLRLASAGEARALGDEAPHKAAAALPRPAAAPATAPRFVVDDDDDEDDDEEDEENEAGAGVAIRTHFAPQAVQGSGGTETPKPRSTRSLQAVVFRKPLAPTAAAGRADAEGPTRAAGGVEAGGWLDDDTGTEDGSDGGASEAGSARNDNEDDETVKVDASGVRWHLESKGGRRLQRHWKRCTDGEDVWFANSRTGETRWEAPLLGGKLTAEARRGASPSLWLRRKDETDVWFEQARDETVTVWELPEGAREVGESELAQLLLPRGGRGKVASRFSRTAPR